MDVGVMPGGRISGAAFFDPLSTFGVYSSILGAKEDRNRTYSGQAVLSRPFFNVEPTVVGEDAEVISLPGLASGRVQVTTESDTGSAGSRKSCWSRTSEQSSTVPGLVSLTERRSVNSTSFGLATNSTDSKWGSSGKSVEHVGHLKFL